MEVLSSNYHLNEPQNPADKGICCFLISNFAKLTILFRKEEYKDTAYE